MPYAVAADLTTYVDSKTLILLADDNADGIADAAVLTGALTNASARIDAALLSASFVVPVAVPGAFLISLCARLCLAGLYSRRPETQVETTLDAVVKGAEDELKRITQRQLIPPEAVRSTEDLVSGGTAVSSDDDIGWGTDI
jgi:phage gp36-like protein